MLRLWGHVVLIVFGKHLVCSEQAIGPELALGHYPFTLTKQVGQYSRITDRYHFGGIGHNELHRKSIALALHAAGLHHATDAKRPLLGCFPGTHLRRRKKEHKIALKSIEH